MLSVLVILLLASDCQPTVERACAPANHGPASSPASAASKFRVATFNIRELSAAKIHACDSSGRGNDPQVRKAAEIIQRVRPDVWVINEIDFDADKRTNADRFLKLYLNVPQGEQSPVEYPFIFFAPVNTGMSTGHDLNNDGKSDGPDDAFGFGKYPGQYGMAVYSRLPLDVKAARTFQTLPWRAMPGNHMPDGRDGSPDFYSAEEAAILRLSSKSHWDVPVAVGGTTIHLLVSHPTPPVFDGPEDRNGRRNFDEVRFWADYITSGAAAEYIVDDAGQRGGLAPDVSFIVLGDLNADSALQNAEYGRTAIAQLLDHARIQDPQPRSQGAAADRPRRPYSGDVSLRTAEFGRADYVLPSNDLSTLESGVFWPLPDAPEAGLVYGANGASDHRLVWVDIEFRARSASE